MDGKKETKMVKMKHVIDIQAEVNNEDKSDEHRGPRPHLQLLAPQTQIHSQFSVRFYFICSGLLLWFAVSEFHPLHLDSILVLLLFLIQFCSLVLFWFENGDLKIRG
ncbi:unnamed protein product [Lathyrus sativus]|nr:unnamed protein product [Lathyrus sativus]